MKDETSLEGGDDVSLAQEHKPPRLVTVYPIVFTKAYQASTMARVLDDRNDYHGWATHVAMSLHRQHMSKMRDRMFWLEQELPVTASLQEQSEPIVSKGTDEQFGAWCALCQRQNVCILGPGGTGKSQFINWVKQIYLEAGQVVITTASTANAAFLLQGVTVHKFAGLPVICCDESKMSILEAVEKYVKHAQSLVSVVNNILQTQLWICDEISMISPRIFQLVDIAFRYFRQTFDRPFGGCQFLWSGDFLQIPPVVKQAAGRKRYPNESTYLFSHTAWVDSWQPWVISFTTNKRSNQLVWSQLLARVRMGCPTDADLAALRSRTMTEMRFRGELDGFLDDIVTHIYPTNIDVARENNLARSRLYGPDHVFVTSFCTTTNVLPGFSERDEMMYSAWSQTSWACPPTWIPETGKQQEILSPESPWYNVLCRSIFLETSLVRNRIVTDEECHASLLAYAEKFMNESRLPVESRFRIGEKVRLTTNVAQSRGLVNGMTGHIVGFLLNDSSEYEWQGCNLKQLKRFMNSIFSDWFLVGDEWSEASPDQGLLLDDQDVWTRALDVNSYPVGLDEVDSCLQLPRAVRGPTVPGDLDLSEMKPLGQIRAYWFGSVANEDSDRVARGEFLWTDDPRAPARGLPVVQWSIGSRTIVPMYDWSVDFSGLMGKGPDKKRRDRWQIHLFALPLKPAHAMTYHDCQGQTCRKVLLGSVSRLFTENMLYVGLSRAPNLESVCLSDDFAARCIMAHPQALDFFRALEPSARRDEARRDEARLDEARRDEARLDEARRDEARRDEARLDEARLDEARLDEARRDEARRDEKRESLPYPVFQPRKRPMGLEHFDQL